MGHPATALPGAAQRLSLSAARALLGVALVALAFVACFRLNEVLFDASFKVSDTVSWVFLPAAIRMVAVLLLGWAGVAGLFLGSLVVDGHRLAIDAPGVVMHALLGSVPSLLAARALQRGFGLPGDLRGLTGAQLLGFSLAGAGANSLSHTLYWALRAESAAPLAGFVPMFVGDTVGAALVLYAAALVLRRIRAS